MLVVVVGRSSKLTIIATAHWSSQRDSSRSRSGYASHRWYWHHSGRMRRRHTENKPETRKAIKSPLLSKDQWKFLTPLFPYGFASSASFGAPWLEGFLPFSFYLKAVWLVRPKDTYKLARTRHFQLITTYFYIRISNFFPI